MDISLLIKEIELRIKKNGIFYSVLLGTTGVAASYFGGYDKYYEYWKWYNELMDGSSKILPHAVVIITTIYALSVPFSINLISNKLAPYDDRFISKFFLKIWVVKYQIYIYPILIGYILVLIFVDLPSVFNNTIVLFGVLYSLFMTVKYFKKIIDISFNVGSYVVNWSLDSALKNLHTEESDFNEFYADISRLFIAGRIAIETNKPEVFFESLNGVFEILDSSKTLLSANHEKFNEIFKTQVTIKFDKHFNWKGVKLVNVSQLIEQDAVAIHSEESLISYRNQVQYGFHTFMEGLDSWRETGYQTNSPQFANEINDGLLEWVKNMTHSADKSGLNVRLILKTCVNNLIYQSLPQFDKPNLNTLNQSRINWYFDLIKNVNVHQYQNELDELLLRSLFYSLETNQSNIIIEFGERIVQGIRTPFFRYDGSALNNTRIITYRDSELMNWFLELKEQIQNVYSLKETNELQNRFTLFLNCIQHETNEGYLIELNSFKSEFIDGVIGWFQRQNIEIIMLHVGGRLILDGDWATLSYLLNFKQPVVANASWGGRDMFPVHVSEILQHGLNIGIHSQRFDPFWKGHNDGKHWIHQLLYILIARSAYLPTIGRISFTDPILDSDQLNLLKELKRFSGQNETLLSEEIYPGFKGFKFDVFDEQLDLLISNSENAQKNN